MTKVKSGQSVAVKNHGKTEIGVVKKRYTLKGVTYYDVLLERGAFLEGITDNPQYETYVKVNLKPVSGSLEAKIDPEKYDFTVPNDTINPFSTED